jgi:hypothetical protein
MLSSIHPLGERAKGNRYAVTAGAHLVGGALGGATTGALLGAVGMWLVPHSGSVALIAGAACVTAVAFELAGKQPPSWRRQVNEDWLTEYRGVVYGFGFGYELGLGWATIVTSAITWAVLGCALLSASVIGGALIGSAFGLARASVLVAARGITTPDALRGFHAAMADNARRARSATVIGLAAAAGYLIVSGVA